MFAICNTNLNVPVKVVLRSHNIASPPFDFLDLPQGRLAQGRKEGNVLFNDASTHFNTVIWFQTYDKGRFR